VLRQKLSAVKVPWIEILTVVRPYETRNPISRLDYPHKNEVLSSLLMPAVEMCEVTDNAVVLNLSQGLRGKRVWLRPWLLLTMEMTQIIMIIISYKPIDIYTRTSVKVGSCVSSCWSHLHIVLYNLSICSVTVLVGSRGWIEMSFVAGP